MKPELKRIEAALQQAAKQHFALRESLRDADPHPNLPPPPAVGPFDDFVSVAEHTRLERSPAKHAAPDADSERATMLYTTMLSNAIAEKAPTLPEFTVTQESRQFVAITNSALALNLIQDLQGMVANWLTALDEVVRAIQALYDEGPIVDGWLEAGDTTPVATYRLCGLGEDGQVWQRGCPVEQVPDVSLAIARYQRLQLLLTRRRSLESRLNVLAEALINLHGEIAKLED